APEPALCLDRDSDRCDGAKPLHDGSDVRVGDRRVVIKSGREPRAVHGRRRQRVVELPSGSEDGLIGAISDADHEEISRIAIEPADHHHLRAEQRRDLVADRGGDLGRWRSLGHQRCHAPQRCLLLRSDSRPLRRHGPAMTIPLDPAALSGERAPSSAGPFPPRSRPSPWASVRQVRNASATPPSNPPTRTYGGGGWVVGGSVVGGSVVGGSVVGGSVVGGAGGGGSGVGGTLVGGCVV